MNQPFVLPLCLYIYLLVFSKKENVKSIIVFSSFAARGHPLSTAGVFTLRSIQCVAVVSVAA